MKVFHWHEKLIVKQNWPDQISETVNVKGSYIEIPTGEKGTDNSSKQKITTKPKRKFFLDTLYAFLSMYIKYVNIICQTETDEGESINMLWI